MKKYFIPILLFIWALSQFVLTQTTHLSPWKLGGFGMYSDYHPEDHFLWIQIGKQRFSATKIPEFRNDVQYNTLLSSCRSNPSDKNSIELRNYIEQRFKENTSVEVWRINFDFDTKTLSTKLVSKNGSL